MCYNGSVKNCMQNLFCKAAPANARAVLLWGCSRVQNKKEKNMKKEITFEELKKSAEPIAELLRAKGHPHMTVIVTENYVRIVEDLIGTPFQQED